MKIRNIIKTGIATMSLTMMLMAGVKAEIAPKIYDANNQVLSNYEIIYADFKNSPSGYSSITGEQYYNNMICLNNLGQKVTNKWIRIVGYDLQGRRIRDAWYYYDQNGFCSIGWKLINGKWYHFTDDTSSDCVGIMSCEEETDDGYLVGKDGALITTAGWYKIHNTQYYVNSNGKVISKK